MRVWRLEWSGVLWWLRPDLGLLHRRVASDIGGINDGDGNDGGGCLGECLGALHHTEAERERVFFRGCGEPSELVRVRQ